MTSQFQPLDVSVNEPFEGLVRTKHEKRLLPTILHWQRAVKSQKRPRPKLLSGSLPHGRRCLQMSYRNHSASVVFECSRRVGGWYRVGRRRWWDTNNWWRDINDRWLCMTNRATIALTWIEIFMCNFLDYPLEWQIYECVLYSSEFFLLNTSLESRMRLIFEWIKYVKYSLSKVLQCYSQIM